MATPASLQNIRPISFWHESIANEFTHRDSITSDIESDIAIVGAGYSGLWTAYYLKIMNPNLRIVVVESQSIGFGASGRNGGWCTGFLPVTLSELSDQHGRQAAIDMYRESFATVNEVERVLFQENIDCDFQKGGTINGATNVVQQSRVIDEVREFKSFGFTESDIRMLSLEESQQRINVNGLVASSFTPHCAAIHPAKLVVGLAQAVERLGVRIYENSPVRAINKHELLLNHYRVRADVVVRATEGFTSQLAKHRRTLVPLYSYMVATEPLSVAQRQEIRWNNRETYHDARNMIIYVQITRDGRVAFGGRGAPYHFASRVKPEYDLDTLIHDRIISAMHEVFPVTREVPVSHRWGGPLGVPRNWHPSVNYDPKTSMASLGGYVGNGVASTNLAARTLAHLITGENHPLTNLAWVNHPSRRWEIEPLRYIGVNGLLKMSNQMDRHEKSKGTPDKIRSKILDIFL